MLSRFRLELDVAIDTFALPTVIAAARQHYAKAGGAYAVATDGATLRRSVDEFINGIEQALMELV
jgi:hypothetical protein